MRAFWSYLVARIKEPSTWAGVGTLIYAGAHAVATRDPASIAAVVAGVGAVVAPEGHKAPGSNPTP